MKMTVTLRETKSVLMSTPGTLVILVHNLGNTNLLQYHAEKTPKAGAGNHKHQKTNATSLKTLPPARIKPNPPTPT